MLQKSYIAIYHFKSATFDIKFLVVLAVYTVHSLLCGAYFMLHIICGIYYTVYNIGIICENVNEWQRYKSWMWRLFGLEWPSNSQNCLTMTTTKFFYSASLLPHSLNYMVGLLSVLRLYLEQPATAYRTISIFNRNPVSVQTNFPTGVKNCFE